MEPSFYVNRQLSWLEFDQRVLEEALDPQVPGASEGIRAISIVDRYLEHARVFSIHNGGQPEVFLASADWMPRNLDHRIEVAFPIVDPVLRQSVQAFLQMQLTDTVKARVIGPDGRSHHVARGSRPAVRAQDRAYEILQAPSLGAAPPGSPEPEVSASPTAS